MLHRLSLKISFALMIITIAGCNSASTTPTIDANTIYTQAAQTVQVGLTMTQDAMPTATITPQPTATLPPTVAITDTPAVTDTPAGLPTLETTSQPTLSMPTSTVQVAGDHATFLYNVPGDNTVFSPGKEFTLAVGWQNTGTTTWNNGYHLVFLGGKQLSGITSIPVSKDVKPGQKYEFDIAQTAPKEKGKYITRWKFTNAQGVYLGEFYLKFSVQ